MRPIIHSPDSLGGHSLRATDFGSDNQLTYQAGRLQSGKLQKNAHGNRGAASHVSRTGMREHEHFGANFANGRRVTSTFLKKGVAPPILDLAATLPVLKEL